MSGADQGQRHSLSGRGGVLQGQQRHSERGQRGERPSQHQVRGGVSKQEPGLVIMWPEYPMGPHLNKLAR